MRTEIFNTFVNLSKETQEEFQILWKLSQDQRLALIPRVVEAYKAVTIGLQKEITEKAVTEIGGNTADLLRAMDTLLFIYQRWSPLLDERDPFLKDLSDLGLLPPDDLENATTFMIEFLKEVEKDNERRLKKIYAGSIIPTYTGCSTVVDYRVIVRNPYASRNPDEKIENYNPECIGFVPVVVIKIKRDSIDNTDFDFQAGEDELKILIDSLKAGLKELEAAKVCWPVDHQNR
jgi:hypothetical protein